MRSIVLFGSFFALTAGCRAVPPSEKEGNVGHNLDEIITEAVVNDTAEIEVEDTSEEVDESCAINAQWNVENPIVSIDAFVMPHLEVSSDCASPTAVGAIEIYFSSDRWLEQIGDTRLGVGTEYEHLGVYGATEFKCQQDRCGVLWDIDPTSYDSAYPTSDYTVSFGFSLAAFADDENMTEIDELWDDVSDEVILTAVINPNGEGGVVTQATITIVATE